MSKLIEFLKRLGAEPELAKAYEENPRKVMEEAGLNKEEMALLQEGDTKKLEAATGLKSLKKITIIIKAYED